MRFDLRLPLATLAAAAPLASAAPAAACTLMGISPDYIGRVVKDGQATWVGRVSVVTPEPGRTIEPLQGPGGTATIVFERRIRGPAGTQITVSYDTAPYCGYPWSPRVGDQVLVIQYPTGPRLFTQAQVASSRYERYLTR